MTATYAYALTAQTAHGVVTCTYGTRVLTSPGSRAALLVELLEAKAAELHISRADMAILHWSCERDVMGAELSEAELAGGAR